MPCPKHFALLIGVDFYIRQPLHSCVQDVDFVEGYLKKLQQDKILQSLWIIKLSASLPTKDGPGPCQPPESEAALPTIHNIKENLSQILTESTEGDFVYVHFSGHGTNSPDDGMALVPYGCDDGETEELRNCLSGTDLAKLLNEFTTAGVKVLLVLDCCFSGGIPRSGLPDAVRYIPFHPFPNVNKGDDMQSRPRPPSAASNDAVFRGALTRNNWLMEPQSYTILTACGPTQTTCGLRLEDGSLYGMLTYTLIRTLRRLYSLNISHMAIFQFVCARFRAMESHQFPQLKGRGDFTFFGHLQGMDDSFFPIAKSSSGNLLLHAGYLMGVQEDEKLVLSPLSALAEEKWDKEYALATACNVGGVTAEVVIKDDMRLLNQIDWSWIARPLKLCQQFQRGNSHYIQRSTSHGTTVNLLLPPGHTEDTAPFLAGVNEQGKYEIKDRQGQVIHLKTISLLSANAPGVRSHVFGLLAYLVRYHDLRNLETPSQFERLRRSVEIKFCRNSGIPFLEDGSVWNVSHGEDITLTIVNTGVKKVFVNVLLLSADWKINNILEAEGTMLEAKASEGEQCNIADRKITVRSEMVVPDELLSQGISSCKDIFKVLIANEGPFAGLASVQPTHRGPPLNFGDIQKDSWVASTFHIRTFK